MARISDEEFEAEWEQLDAWIQRVMAGEETRSLMEFPDSLEEWPDIIE